MHFAKCFNVYKNFMLHRRASSMVTLIRARINIQYRHKCFPTPPINMNFEQYFLVTPLNIGTWANHYDWPLMVIVCPKKCMTLSMTTNLNHICFNNYIVNLDSLLMSSSCSNNCNCLCHSISFS